MKSRQKKSPSLAVYKNSPFAPINGVGRLPAVLTINGITEYPVLRYTAGGGMVDAAAWNPWGYGEALPVVAAGVAPTLRAGSPGLGALDDSVLFNASDYFQAAGNAFADITTEDFVVEVVFKVNGNGFQTIASSKAAGNTPGYNVYLDNAWKLSCAINSTGPIVVATNALNNSTWYYAICFLDRSGGGVWYLNGLLQSANAISTQAGSLSTATNFTIGANSDGSNLSANNIAYLAMYKRDAWLDTHLQDTIAEQRASLYWGWRPQQVRGTAVPTVRTRASNAYLDKREGAIRKYYLVGNNIPRAVDRIDKNGARIRGYLPEVQITNLILRSGEIDKAAWTKTRSSVTNTSTTTLPNGITSVSDVIHEDATATNSHVISQNITLTENTKYCMSAWVKAINRTWCSFRTDRSGAGTGVAFFDVGNGVVGGVTLGTGTNPISGIEDWGNGWYRCWMTFTPGTTGVTTHWVFASEGDLDNVFDGLDQNSLYCWGVQVEAGVDYPTSYMPTAAAAVIREEDVLRYKGDDGNLGGVGSNKRGQINVKMFCENYDAAVGKRILTLSDGGAAADQITANVTIADVLDATSAATGGTAGSWTGTTDVVDGEVHEVKIPYKANYFGAGIVDGTTEGTSDSDCSMPDNIDRIDVGVDESGTLQPGTVLSDIELFSEDEE